MAIGQTQASITLVALTCLQASLPLRFVPDAIAPLTDPLVEGAAAMFLGFSFLGFFASRFLCCSRCAMASSRQ